MVPEWVLQMSHSFVYKYYLMYLYLHLILVLNTKLFALLQNKLISNLEVIIHV